MWAQQQTYGCLPVIWQNWGVFFVILTLGVMIWVCFLEPLCSHVLGLDSLQVRRGRGRDCFEGLKEGRQPVSSGRLEPKTLKTPTRAFGIHASQGNYVANVRAAVGTVTELRSRQDDWFQAVTLDSGRCPQRDCGARELVDSHPPPTIKSSQP